MATAALAIAHGAPLRLWRLLPLVFVQRFCYRQLLYVTAVRVAAAALKGRMLGWGKLMRTGRDAAADAKGGAGRPSGCRSQAAPLLLRPRADGRQHGGRAAR